MNPGGVATASSCWAIRWGSPAACVQWKVLVSTTPTGESGPSPGPACTSERTRRVSGRSTSPILSDPAQRSSGQAIPGLANLRISLRNAHGPGPRSVPASASRLRCTPHHRRAVAFGRPLCVFGDKGFGRRAPMALDGSRPRHHRRAVAFGRPLSFRPPPPSQMQVRPPSRRGPSASPLTFLVTGLVTGLVTRGGRIEQGRHDTVGRKALMLGHEVRVLTQRETDVVVTEVVGRRWPTQFG